MKTSVRSDTVAKLRKNGKSRSCKSVSNLLQQHSECFVSRIQTAVEASCFVVVVMRSTKLRLSVKVN